MIEVLMLILAPFLLAVFLTALLNEIWPERLGTPGRFWITVFAIWLSTILFLWIVVIW